MVESAGKDSRRNGHQKSVSTKKTHRVRFLEYPADGDGDGGLLGELGATDVEGIESICAVGAVFVPINHQSLTSNFSPLIYNRWFRRGCRW